MKRSFLKELNLDIEVIDKIMAENGKDIKKYKDEIEEYVSEIKELKSNAMDSAKSIEKAVKEKEKELRNEFDTKKRSDLAVKIQQEVLNDCGYTYASHLKMSFVMKNNVKGFEAHPSDFYEITANTDIE